MNIPPPSDFESGSSLQRLYFRVRRRMAAFFTGFDYTEEDEEPRFYTSLIADLLNPKALEESETRENAPTSDEEQNTNDEINNKN